MKWVIDASVGAKWLGYIARRLAELDQALVEGIPAEKVFAEMRAMTEVHAFKG